MASPVQPCRAETYTIFGLASIDPGEASLVDLRAMFKNALWITPETTRNNPNLYFRARSVFDLKDFPRDHEACIKLSAESFYKLWVNGHLVGAGPARGSRSVNFFDTLEIGAFLHPGRNVVGVLVHCANRNTNLAYPVCGGGLLAEIEGITHTGDGRWKIRDACDEWLPLEGSSFVLNVGFSECRDFNKEPENWLEGADDGQWREPCILGLAPSAIPGKRLLPRPVPMQALSNYLPQTIACVAETRPIAGFENEKVDVLMSSEPHDPAAPALESRLVALTLAETQEVTIDPPGHGRGVTVMFGFGREIIGFFEAEIGASSAGVIVDIAYDEEIREGRMLNAYRIADRYLLKKGANKVGTSLLERGFRWVEVSIRKFNAPVTIRAVKAVDRRYPVARRAAFFCSDMVLNRVWDISVETLSACATDIFNDCPWRERAFWVNDLLVENLTWLQAMGDCRLNAHALRLAFSNLRADGWMPGVAPDFDEPRMVLVATNLFPPLMLRDYLNYSGDLELVRELLPRAVELLGLFDALEDESGLFCPPGKFWNFLDWSYYYAEGFTPDPLDGRRTSMVEWLRCMALEEAASLLELCGDFRQAEMLRAKIEKIAAAVKRHFWLEGAKRCSDWLENDGTPSRKSSQLTHALALLSHRLSAQEQAQALEALDDPALLVPEFYLHHFVFGAMEANGLGHKAVERVRRYWGELALTGTPTLWESFIGKRGKEATPVDIGSLCHGFATSSIGVLQRNLLGVRPTGPGFKEFTFAPRPCGLQFATGRVPTPSGDICVDWSVDAGELRAKLVIPAGLNARLADGTKLPPGRHEVRLDATV